MRIATARLTIASTVCAVVLAACGGDTTDTVVVDQYALDLLQEYAFVSQIEVQSEEGDLRATYDAVTEGLMRVQGSFSGEGDLLASLDVPSETEVISTEEEIWMRGPGGEWQPVPPGTSRGPGLLRFVNLVATPPLYLQYFIFGGLQLETHGSEEVRGLETARARLDRDQIIALVPGVTHLNVPDEGPQRLSREEAAGLQDAAIEVLPEDFAVETWVVRNARYPVRIVIEFTVPDAEEGLLVEQLPAGARVRLQMDIFDTDVDVDIQPPDA